MVSPEKRVVPIRAGARAEWPLAPLPSAIAAPQLNRRLHMIRKLAFAAALGLAAPAAFAQTADAPGETTLDAAATYQAARNQLGILQFCQTQGHTGAEAVEAQTQLLAMIPAGDEAAGASAEQAGAEGTVSVGETQITLAEAAEAQGTTVEATCQQIEAAVNQVASSLQAG
jgi:hypothetical protein